MIHVLYNGLLFSIQVHYSERIYDLNQRVVNVEFRSLTIMCDSFPGKVLCKILSTVELQWLEH